MRIELLADNRNTISTLANWYFAEWGHLKKGNTLTSVEKSLHNYLNTSKIPLIMVAIEAGKILGAAQVKFREMDIYPEKEHWLGGVYVSKNHRGKNIAREIIQEATFTARELGVKTLYLQTERLDGGLYRHLGWQPLEIVNYRGLTVLVMARELSVIV